MKNFRIVVTNILTLVMMVVLGPIIAPLMLVRLGRVHNLLWYGSRGYLSGLSEKFLIGLTIRPEDILFSGGVSEMPRWIFNLDVSYWSLQDSEAGPIMFIKVLDNRKIKKLKKKGYIK